jgi:uncharacterized repeat protein (TIGR03943 family)
MRRVAQALVLLLTGGVLIRVAMDDTATRYLRSAFSPALVGTGAALIALGGYTLWRAWRVPTVDEVDPSVSPEDPSRGGGARGRAPGPGTTVGGGDRANGWPLLVVVLALLVIAPPALGVWWGGRSATMVSSRALVPAAPTTSLPAGDPVRLTVAQYAARALTDGGATLQGRVVRLTGFVVAGPAQTMYLTRLVLGCCAAGARPAKVGLSGILPSNLAAGDWVEVDGGYTPRQDRDPVTAAPVPYIDVSAVRSIPEPSDPYDPVG